METVTIPPETRVARLSQTVDAAPSSSGQYWDMISDIDAAYLAISEALQSGSQTQSVGVRSEEKTANRVGMEGASGVCRRGPDAWRLRTYESSPQPELQARVLRLCASIQSGPSLGILDSRICAGSENSSPTRELALQGTRGSGSLVARSCTRPQNGEKPYARQYPKSHREASKPGRVANAAKDTIQNELGCIPTPHVAPRITSRSASRISYYRLNKGLSVSDWLKPMWCQSQASEDEKNQLGKRQPTEIDRMGLRWLRRTPGKRTSAQVDGTQIHEAVLGSHPAVAMTKNSLRREEYFMLSIVAFLRGCLSLRRNGHTTELPVFGLVRGIRTMGFIDCVQVGGESPHVYVVLNGSRLKLVEVKTVIGLHSVPDQPYTNQKLQAMIYHLLLQPLLKNVRRLLETLHHSYSLDPALAFAEELMRTTASEWAMLSQHLHPGHGIPSPRTLFDVSQLAGLILQSYGLPPLDNDVTVAYHRRFGSPQPTSRGSAALPFNPLGGSTFLTARTISYDEAWLNTTIEPAFKWWTAAPDSKSEGVPVEETSKCETCDYKQRCTARREKHEEILRDKGLDKHIPLSQMLDC
ncbi:putative defects in morphology protein 1 [Mycena kentingensis (nom. inval.)]|nr:putative defects in morphology protein 1 [Mycena kentingensis (nom. inval.)]